MPIRSAISLKKAPAITATRVATESQKLVYILVADKRIKYREGRSRIVYIGTTKKGVARIASSAAERAKAILALHGVSSFSARVVTCRPRQKVQTWRTLERAFLLTFRAKFGDVPRCNSHGRKMIERREFEIFSRARVEGILDELG